MGEGLRVELIRRLCEVPETSLPAIEHFLRELNEPKVDGQAAPAGELGEPQPRDWPHAPIHRLNEHGTYIVTAGTLHKEHVFRGRERLELLESHLLTLARTHGVQLEAWAVFSNHYHFVGHTTESGEQLKALLSHLHTSTAAEVNRLDGTTGRDVWHNFWDTRLTFEKSYLARLNYVHQNAVKHGLAAVACQYRWCSAAWFERTATPAQVKTIYSFKIDRIGVQDDFQPV